MCNTVQHELTHRHTSTRANTVQHTRCNTMEHVSTHVDTCRQVSKCGDVWQHTLTPVDTCRHMAKHVDSPQKQSNTQGATPWSTRQHSSTHIDTRRHTSTCVNTVQHTRCNTMEHVSPHVARGVGTGGSEGSDDPPFLGANFIHFLYKVLGHRSVKKQPF